MVTKNLIRISPDGKGGKHYTVTRIVIRTPEKKVVAVASDSNRREEHLKLLDDQKDVNDNDESSSNDVEKQTRPQQATDERIVAENDDTIDEEKSAAADHCLSNNTSKKRHLLMEDAEYNGKTHTRKKQKFIDLTSVPDQLPILKRNGKSGSSKYQGVTFNKPSRKWQARIMIDGKLHYIGFYDNEEEAAKDYARAVFKYRGGEAGFELLQQQQRELIDLRGVPDQLPILSNREGSSKYQGVYFNKACKKWYAQIWIDGKQHSIGHYDSEEEAGKDYARAVYKYRGRQSAIERRQRFIDMAGVPDQLPILKSNGRKSGSSKYQGVTFHKASEKWQAQIYIDGKYHYIGYYDNEEEAAKDYARAVVKYRGGKAAVERKQRLIDLSDVLEQLPILNGRSDKRGSSKYQGVHFDTARKKWHAQIRIDGKTRHIGLYDDEEEAAKDYARALFKYRDGQSAIERQRRQQLIDLTDVPEQLPILKRCGKTGSSKYQGVTFHQAWKKWQAQISIDGKNHVIGHYDNEEEAVKAYARALFKYRPGQLSGES